MTNEEFFSIRKKIIEKDFSGLNDMQKKAVFSTEGPLLVLAGAGSGKTTVLVNRIYNIIKYGSAYNSDKPVGEISAYEQAMIYAALQTGEISDDISHLFEVNKTYPWQILAITFTNKAAGELKDRLVNKLGEAGNDIWASTFHSACVRILRKNAELVGYSSNFTIYDTDDSKKVIKDCIKSLGLDEKIVNPKTALYEISNAKNNLIPPDEYIEDNSYYFDKAYIGKTYKLYQEKLKASDAMDFDDIIYNAVILLRDNPAVLDYYQNKFRYILVDEYQDTNHLQYLLISLLAEKYKNVCVVGDDDQSIYRFRGATIENILNFEDEYSDAKVIRLEQNYRSTQNILDAANAVISNNINRKGKNLWTDNGSGEYITRHIAETDLDEAAFIVGTIMNGLNKGKKESDFAVLYRMNSQSNLIERVLVQQGIPYKIIGGHKFYDRKEIKDIISYLSYIANPNDSVRLARIINEPKRGIGDSSFNAVMEISDGLDMSPLDVMLHADDYPKLSRASKKLISFAQMIRSFINFSEVNSISDLLSEVLETSGYIDALDLEPERKEDRRENLDQLKNNILLFEQENENAVLNDYLQEVSLMTDIDNYNEDNECVVLMTVHSAKGLEFNTVFIAGAEESIFPSQLSLDEGEAGVEEERRLAYVAITRAKEKLYLTACKSRMLFGMTRFNPPSRFIDEIPSELIRPSEINIRRSSYEARTRINDAGNTVSKRVHSDNGFSGVSKKPVNKGVVFKVGDAVTHSTYGDGVIISVTPMANDQLLEIAFVEGKTKKIMANFAKIEKK